jgi:hydroxyacylglutathione hydrolase
LQAILVTHHHHDHVGGVAELQAATQAPVYGPADEPITLPLQAVHHQQTHNWLGLRWQVLRVPGHTAGHVAYYAERTDGAPLLFCGDTLFSAGCGRLFEGTPADMLASLDTLAALPDTTQVCCAHEYTLANLRFACAVEADNAALQAYQRHCVALRAQQQPTLPSTLATEKAINPFLRTHIPAVVAAACAHEPQLAPQDRVAVLAALRSWKNVFQ